MIYYKTLKITSVIALPKHCGISALHKPRELHSALTVPVSTKPFSQLAVHREPKVKGPFGSEQDRKPCGSSIGWHFFTLRSRKAREGSVIHKHRHHCLPDILKTEEQPEQNSVLIVSGVVLPWQTGSPELHWPCDEHSVIFVPIKSKPSLH